MGRRNGNIDRAPRFGGFGNDVFVDGHFTIKLFFFKAANSLISLGITLINDG